MRKIYIFLSCFILCFISCKDNKGDETRSKGTTQIQVSLEKEFPTTEYSVVVDFIPLETSADYLVGQVQVVLVKNDLIYIKSINDDQILVFEKDGRIKNKLSCKGKGPGEYLQIIDFMVDSVGNIYVLDPLSIKKYDSNCKFIDQDESFKKNRKLVPVSFYVAQSGYKYFWNISYSDPQKNKRDKIFIYDKDKLIGSYFNIGQKDYFSKRFYDYGNKILIEPSKFDYSILKVEDEVISEEYLLDFGSFSIPEEYQSETYKVSNRKDITKTIVELSVFWDIHYPIETDKYLAFLASKEDENYQFIYDKKRGVCFNAVFQDNNPLQIWNIIGTIDSSFFSVIEPATLSEYIEKMGNEERKDLLLKLGGCDLNGNINPIIITWTIDYDK